MSPRPFERPATILLPEVDGLAPGSSLDGLWLPPRPIAPAADGAGADEDDAAGAPSPRGGAIVAPPHPLMGGSLDSPVVTEVALAASDAGYCALRFNWRGIGASAGTPSGEVGDADTDYRAALDFMQESVEGSLLACGYSWGALAAARIGVGHPRVRKLVLVAPPPAMLDAAALADFGRPLLVIAGDRDEYVPLDALREMLSAVGAHELVVLEGVDHFFMSGLEEVGRSVRGWLDD
jgi:alpha/beta superfamily hydrolase